MSKIEGTYEFTQFLKRYPLECNKIIRKALGASGRIVASSIRRMTPVPKWKRLVKSKVSMSRESGRLYVRAGYFGAKRGSAFKKDGFDSNWEFFKAYWLNNGTLKRRDPDHEFTYPPGVLKVKYDKKGNIKSKPRNREGITPRNFYEKSVEGLEPKVERVFVRSIEKQHEQLIKLNAKKP